MAFRVGHVSACVPLCRIMVWIDPAESSVRGAAESPARALGPGPIGCGPPKPCPCHVVDERRTSIQFAEPSVYLATMVGRMIHHVKNGLPQRDLNASRTQLLFQALSEGLRNRGPKRRGISRFQIGASLSIVRASPREDCLEAFRVARVKQLLRLIRPHPQVCALRPIHVGQLLPNTLVSSGPGHVGDCEPHLGVGPLHMVLKLTERFDREHTVAPWAMFVWVAGQPVIFAGW